ncbi:MAG: hypothetical protein FRX48_04993 [Lasallia pustulata]|uniref:Peroxisomal adenine nucleotide transporter 1 n=1 Tax=Lasallia pustulata TaxID=136370 RepID=A0A5M8PRN9_9LECA|nr:MAG: hypothetical protein FRX48_04993 [Lasallia pustulata]
MTNVYNSQLDAFSIYHKVHERDSGIISPALPALGHALAGATGGTISNIFTYPLDLIITRLQLQRQLRKDFSSPDSAEYKGIRDAAQKIYSQEGGALGFYQGILEDTTKTVADTFLFFLAYNFIRNQRLQAHKSSRSLPVIDELSVGFLAGAFSKLLTTPISNIVTRKQTASMLSNRSGSAKEPSVKPTSARAIAHQIYGEKGLAGFWSGYSASLILTLNPSLTFFLYETFKRSLLPRSQRDHPPPSATFLLAAVSKAIASTITYPFSLAKTRAQVTSRGVDDNDQEIKESLENAPGPGIQTTKRERKAARMTVFSTILHIAKTEGIAGLYEGLAGEVLKGFFSHGITMIVKEAVHNLIIKLYFTILKVLKRFPSPHELAQQSKDQVSSSAEYVRDGASNAITQGQKMAKSGYNQIGEAYQGTKARASEFAQSVGATASNASNQAAEGASQTYKKGKDLAAGSAQYASETTSQAYEKTKDAAAGSAQYASDTTSQAYEKTKDAAAASAQYASDTTTQAYEKSKDAAAGSAQHASDTTSQAYQKSKDAAAGSAQYASDSTSRAYEQTKDAATASAQSAANATAQAYDTAATAADSAASAVGGTGAEAYELGKGGLERAREARVGVVGRVGRGWRGWEGD